MIRTANTIIFAALRAARYTLGVAQESPSGNSYISEMLY